VPVATTSAAAINIALTRLKSKLIIGCEKGSHLYSIDDQTECSIVSLQITLQGGNAPMQVDGEPWEQHPGVVHICHHNQATMLAAPS
jgi:hypothetical protein